MTKAMLEHVNITVPDPEKTAQMLCDLFGWKVRWQGPSLGDGFTVHVGTEEDYLALYAPPHVLKPAPENYSTVSALNHIGVVVDDLEAAEQRVLDAGYETHSHAEYEPGKRFYFHDHDGIEFEIVGYK